MSKNMKNIGFIAMAFWVILAILGEIISLIPFVGILVGPLFTASFAFYIWKMGYGFINPRRLAVMGIGAIVEMIPVIQELPVELIITTIVVLFMLKIQKKTGISLSAGVKNGGKSLSTKITSNERSHLNANGVRLPSYEHNNAQENLRKSHITQPLNLDGVRQPNRE